MRQLGVSVLIGAALSSGFRSSVGAALGGIGEMDRGLSGLQRRVLDLGQAWAGISGIKHLVTGASDLSAAMKDAAITAEVTDERMAQVRQTMRQLSAPTETNRAVRDLNEAFNTMVAAGLSDELAGDRDTLRAIGRTATGANANMTDLSKTTYTLVKTLGIKPTGLAAAYDQLNYLGKQGAFELRDMAQHFPELAPQMKLLGITGTEAVVSMGAALQVAKDAAGSQSEAANNMKNFLIKATSPETVKKFAEHGVNLRKVFADAVAKGENPLEAIIKTTDKMLGADPVKRKFRLGALFEDQQAQAFLIAMLDDMEKYNRLKSEALKATGGVDNDYARRMDEFKAKSDAFANAVDKIGDSIGRSLLPPLGAAMAVATPVIGWLADVTDKSPGTTLALTAIGAAITILPPALRLGAYGMRMFGASSAGAAAGVGVMNRALMLNPIGLVVSTLVIGAGLIYDNWEPIKKLFSGMWDSVRPEWEAFTAFVEDWATLTAAPIRTVLELGKAAFNFAKTGELDMSGVQAVRDDAAAAGGRMWDRMAPGEYQRPDFGIDESSMARAAAASAKGQVDVNVNLPNLPKGAQVETNTTGDVGDVFTRTGTQMVLP